MTEIHSLGSTECLQALQFLWVRLRTCFQRIVTYEVLTRHLVMSAPLPSRYREKTETMCFVLSACHKLAVNHICR